MALKHIIFLIQTLTLTKSVWGINQEGVFNHEIIEYKISFGSAPTVNGPVKIYITVNEGDNVTIECNVGGDPTPTKTWYKNTTRLRFTDQICVTNPRIMLDTQGTLVINRATEDDNGNYVCGLRNVNGIATSSAFVTVVDSGVKRDLEAMNADVKKDLEARNLMHLKDTPNNEQTNNVWLTVTLIVFIAFVALVVMVFIIVKMYKKRSENTSKYMVQISPNESINEIQHEFRHHKNESMRSWVDIDVEDGNGFVNNCIINQENGGTMKKDTSGVLLSSTFSSPNKSSIFASTSTNLFDCKCVEPGYGLTLSRPNSPCF